MESNSFFEPVIIICGPDKSYSVDHFKTRQKELAERMFSDDIIENIKGYLQDTMKPMYLAGEDYITRVEIINNHIPWIQPRATKFLERKLIRTVVIKRFLNTWRTALKNAGNHNQTTLDKMATLPIPI